MQFGDIQENHGDHHEEVGYNAEGVGGSCQEAVDIEDDEGY